MPVIALLAIPFTLKAEFLSASELRNFLEARYLSDTGAQIPTNCKIDYFYLATDSVGEERGHVYEVSVVETRIDPTMPVRIKGPIKTYFVGDKYNEIYSYQYSLPEAEYAVFSKVDSADLTSVKEIFVAKINSVDDRDLLHRHLTGSHLHKNPYFAKGQIVESNDGSNFPWWKWSIKNLTITSELDAAENDIGVQKFNEPYALIGLLDSNGRVVAGKVDLGSLNLEGSLSSWEKPQNEMQRNFRNAFATDSETVKYHQALKEALVGDKANSDSLFQVRVEVDGNQTELEIFEVELSTIGMPRGIDKNPNYRHRIVLNSVDGDLLMLFFRNNLHDLIGRPIEFRPSPTASAQEPVAVWFSGPLPRGLSKGITAGFGTSGVSTDHGTVLISDLEVDPISGRLFGLRAELTFEQTQKIGVHKINTRGYARLYIPSEPVRNGSETLDPDCNILLRDIARH
ncbi:MAG: hypothetical protein JWQ35_1390 [Bacteriovoracaceae bacterium]|nr:hypothetical protein [Bacteriovoracaceae bacterium]